MFYIESFLKSVFQNVGERISKKPCPFVLASILTTFILSFGFIFLTIEEDIVKLITTSEALSRWETMVMRQFPLGGFPNKQYLYNHNDSTFGNSFAQNEVKINKNNFMFQMIFIANENESNIINEASLKHIFEVFSFISENFTCMVDKNKAPYTYIPDLCNPKTGCYDMTNGLNMIKLALSKDVKNVSGFKVQYPETSFMGLKVILSPILYGVKVNNESELISASMLLIPLQFQYGASVPEKDLIKCIKQMGNYFLGQSGVNGLNFYPYSENLVVKEIGAVGVDGLKFVPFAFILLLLFCIITNFEKRKAIQSSLVSVVGVITIMISLISGFGIISFFRIKVNYASCIVPFVAAAVTTDNDFLFIASWRHTNPNLPVHKRIGLALSESGPSITVTSLTDILCFGTAVVLTVPAISSTCAILATTLAFRFAYQILFFVATVSFLNSKNKICGIKKIDVANERSEELSNPVVHNFFKLYWSKMFQLKLFRIAVLITYVIYVIFSLIMTCKSIVNVSPLKLINEHSFMAASFKLQTKYVWHSCNYARVFVLNPPDFRNRTNWKLLDRFLDNLENTTYYGKNSVVSTWFKDYSTYYDFMNFHDNGNIDEPADLFYKSLKRFLYTNNKDKFINDIYFRSTNNEYEPNIEKFQFYICYENISNWNDLKNLLLHWRHTCSMYPSLNAVVSEAANMNPFLDNMMIISPTILQALGITILSLMIVTTLMMPNFWSVFLMSISFLSTEIGILGFSVILGCDLDQATMFGCLMTLGFSAYYVVRICYAYQNCSIRMSPDEKLSRAFGATAWPIVQGGLALFIGTFLLYFVPSYLSQTIVKMIFLVILFGEFHGLFIIPLFMYCYDKGLKSSRNRSNV